MSAQLKQLAVNKSWLMKVHRTAEALMSPADLIEKFGTTSITLKDARDDKITHKSFCITSFDRYTEHVLKAVDGFVNFCKKVDCDGERRFDRFEELLEGDAKTQWTYLMEEGHDTWDNANADTNDDFMAAVKAWIIIMTEVNDPGNKQQWQLLNTPYKSTKEEGYLMKPTHFWKRWDMLWKLSAYMPRVGDEPDELTKISALVNGVPETWMDWIRDTKDIDVLDSANNGADALTCSDLFKLLDTKWNEEERPRIRDHVNKNKRKRDGDDDEHGSGGRKHHHGNDNRNHHNRGNTNGGRNNGGRNHGTRGGRGNGGRGRGGRNNQAQSRNNEFYNKDCPIHNGGHKYGDCIFSFGGQNFRRDKADAFAQTGRAPDWWMKTYNKKQDWWSKNNRNYAGNKSSSDPDQQQQYFTALPAQQQEQQFHFQQLPPAPAIAASYAALPPTFPQQQRPQSTPSITDCGAYFLVSSNQGTKVVPK